MTSLPTRLTAEQVAEIRERDKRQLPHLDGPKGDREDRRALLSHIAALEGELAATRLLNQKLTVEHNAMRLDLAACRRDQARYRVVREIVQPRYLSDGFGIKWSDIPNDQTIAEKIDELCDAALSAQAGTQIPDAQNQD